MEAFTCQQPSRAAPGPSAPRAIGGAGLLSRFLAPSQLPLNPSQHNRSGHGQYAAYQRLLLARHPGLISAALGTQAQGLLTQLEKSNLARQSAASSVHGGSAVSTVTCLGFPRGFEDKYKVRAQLGKGGNGTVDLVKRKDTGEEFACKVIPKVLPSTATDVKRAGHLASLKREVQVLATLKGSLNIVKLEDVFEDDENVFIVMELCSGGELHHAIGTRHYSERTAASYMRAVLRTLGQCHAHNVMHRDIKPGNFMLLGDDPRAPLMAIDFGLAVPFEDDQLPRTDLGLEGTPWYMAPETLRSEWLPASDIWAAGVMAFQLLTGRFPYDDFRNPGAPSISAIWKSILCDDLDFKKSYWDGISDDAKDFVKFLLERDPDKRPTAKDALQHPWLKGTSRERSSGKRINAAVVQSIQRYASTSLFKRTILQSIAAELLEQPQLLPATDAVLTSPSGLRRTSIEHPNAAAMESLYKQLKFDGRDTVDKATVAEAFSNMGINLEDSELERLMEEVDLNGDGQELDKSAFAASQMDWRALQVNHKEEWRDMARRAFQSIDGDHDGVLDMDDILTHLRAQLPAEEVHMAVQMALYDAKATQESGIDFTQFLSMLRVGSLDTLDLYDDKMSLGSHGSVEHLNSMLQQSLSDWSHHGPDANGTVHSGRGFAASGVDDRSMHSQNNSSVDNSMHGTGAMQFRFDVGPSTPAAPPPTQQVAFRFDVGPSSTPSKSTPTADAHAGTDAGTVPAASASMGISIGVGMGMGMGMSGAYGGGIANVSGNISPFKPIGGWCDRQHHGSSLYAQMAQNLTTVKE